MRPGVSEVTCCLTHVDACYMMTIVVSRGEDLSLGGGGVELKDG